MTLEQDSRAAGTGEATENQAARGRAGLRPLLWRLHFLGGFLAAPVVLSLAVTGMLFAWNLLIYLAVERLIRAVRSVTDATG